MNHPSPVVRAVYRAGMATGWTEHAIQHASKLAGPRPTQCLQKWKFDSRGVSNLTKDIATGRKLVDLTRQDIKHYPGIFPEHSGHPEETDFHPQLLIPPLRLGPSFGPEVRQTSKANHLYLPPSTFPPSLHVNKKRFSGRVVE